MKNYDFFVNFFKSLSMARRINLIITLVLSIALASTIASVWSIGGCEFIICLLGGIMGFLFPMAIGSFVNDYLAN